MQNLYIQAALKKITVKQTVKQSLVYMQVSSVQFKWEVSVGDLCCQEQERGWRKSMFSKMKNGRKKSGNATSWSGWSGKCTYDNHKKKSHPPREDNWEEAQLGRAVGGFCMEEQPLPVDVQLQYADLVVCWSSPSWGPKAPKWIRSTNLSDF